ncbi:SGNH/GDSL hydrolase family protein [Pseudoclavibacter sp. VKM Ac-2888]|uniref:SGNH/GDSL hydrolase family protein n=1 Tax=Pseudoclavibacter sp. VKM Ac-2888 TaxID=2783830 RepID=UPI00188AD0A5|nr:SGNH/GDSL hydrolase family protein [Pseudoclavibacter sp. VKM Ac-2888]MBF4549471.1 SGNH/GDSL hydrolase family protein [Pseudoclavibacter sp. VKM Ac-2888]
MTKNIFRSTTHSGRARGVLLGIAVLSVAVLSGCTATSAPEASPDASDHSVLWLGDSTAVAEAPALKAAFEAAGVGFESGAADGGGAVVDPGPPMSELVQSIWPDLQKSIAESGADTVMWQVTMYDWGTPEQQVQGLQKLANEVEKAGADLVIISAPPIGDEMYLENSASTATLGASAQSVASASDGQVVYLDAAELWGTDPSDAKALRSSDLTHNCQQGALAFANWLTTKYEALPGGVPAAPVESWGTGSWTGDPVFADWDCPAAGA